MNDQLLVGIVLLCAMGTICCTVMIAMVVNCVRKIMRKRRRRVVALRTASFNRARGRNHRQPEVVRRAVIQGVLDRDIPDGVPYFELPRRLYKISMYDSVGELVEEDTESEGVVLKQNEERASGLLTSIKVNKSILEQEKSGSNDEENGVVVVSQNENQDICV